MLYVISPIWQKNVCNYIIFCYFLKIIYNSSKKSMYNKYTIYLRLSPHTWFTKSKSIKTNFTSNSESYSIAFEMLNLNNTDNISSVILNFRNLIIQFEQKNNPYNDITNSTKYNLNHDMETLISNPIYNKQSNYIYKEIIRQLYIKSRKLRRT
eukprot:Mrub_06144.p2 GENE.Mrub_06144~~Mrub_06144.p2  ORF type:complete len:153 (+),score=2.73 Mrub_06144:183-641(+)